MRLKKLTAAAAAAMFTLSLAGPALAAPEAGQGGSEMAPFLVRSAEDEGGEDTAPGTSQGTPEAPPASAVPAAGEVTFEPNPVDVFVISTFEEDETVKPVYLGGGYVTRTAADGSTEYVTEGLTYAWYETAADGTLGAEPISSEEFLFNDGSLDYDPYESSIDVYTEIISLDGKEVGRQQFILIVVESDLRFEVTAPTDSVEQGPVTLTAQIPRNYDAQVAGLKNLLPELADEEIALTRTISYWGGGAQLDTAESISPQGLPTLTVQPFASTTGYVDLRHIVEYEFAVGEHYGTISMYSRPFRLYAADAAGNESARLFEAPPMTEHELRQLYSTLIAPFHDDTKEDPFALKSAMTDGSGALAAGSKNELFALVNFLRRCAGVDMLTSIDTRKSDFAQAGARFLSEHQVFGHDVAEGQDPDAHEGLMRSNLSNGWWKNGRPYDFTTLQLNQFYDNSASAMPAMEHRQLLLDNRLVSTGFGYMAPTEANIKTYLVTHVDGSELRTTPANSLEAFPGAGAFPVELMNFKGWTLTLGNGWTIPNHSEIKVRVTRDDGTSFELRQLEDPSQAFAAEGDWFCCADKGEVGSGACLLFSPASIFEGGDYKNKDSLTGHTFTIAIEGVVDNHGEDVSCIEYSTTFVSLAEPASEPVPSQTAEPSQQPSAAPSADVSAAPSGTPSADVSAQPSGEPSALPSATGTTRPLPSANLSGLKLETVAETEYVSGILAGKEPHAVSALLERAMAVISHEPDNTFRVVSALENPAALEGTDAVTSGQYLQILSGSGEVLRSIPIVITGDVTGSGQINIAQLAALARHLGTDKKLTGARFVAGDLNGNGAVDIADLAGMAKLL